MGVKRNDANKADAVMNSVKLERIAKKIINAVSMDVVQENDHRIKLRYKENYKGYDILVECDCFITFKYKNEFECIYKLTVSKDGKPVFQEGDLSDLYSSKSIYLHLNSKFPGYVGEYHDKEQCKGEIGEAVEKELLSKMRKRIDDGEFGLDVYGIIKSLGIAECKVCKLCKKRDNASISDTTKLKDSPKALDSLRNFLMENGFSSLKDLHVSVEHGIESYQESEREDDYEYEKYGSGGDRVCVTLNGKTWHWGM